MLADTDTKNEEDILTSCRWERIVKDVNTQFPKEEAMEILDALTYFSNANRVPNVLEDHHLLILARFFSIPLQKATGTKEASLRVLLECYQTNEEIVRDAMRFVTERAFLFDDFQGTEDFLLLWQLRGICLRQIEIRKELKQKIEKIGSVASNYVLKSAYSVQHGVEMSTDVVCSGIKIAGSKLKYVIPPAETRLLESDPKAWSIFLRGFDTAKRRSDGINERSREALASILSSSTCCMDEISHRSKNSSLGEQLMPNERSRTIIRVAGRIVIVGVGASAVVAESLVQSTSQVAKTTAAVAADLIEHRYGLSAATLVKNSHEVVENVNETVGRISLLTNGRAMTRKVANYTSKMHVENPKLLDEPEDSSSSSDLFEPAEGDIFYDQPLPVHYASRRSTSHISPLPGSSENMLAEEFEVGAPITNVDAQSAFTASDTTWDPIYESAQWSYSDKLSTNFLNLDKLRGTSPRSCFMDDNGSLYTAFTVGETCATNSSLGSSTGLPT